MSLSFQSLRNILGFKKPLLNDTIVIVSTNNISDLLPDVYRNQVVTIICVYLQSPLLTSADNEAELLLCSINYGLIKTCKRTRTSCNLFPCLYLSRICICSLIYISVETNGSRAVCINIDPRN